MGIQDNIFDVEDFIDHPAKEGSYQYVKDSFDRIVDYISRLEKAFDENQQYINELETTIKTLRKLDEKGS